MRLAYTLSFALLLVLAGPGAVAQADGDSGIFHLDPPSTGAGPLVPTICFAEGTSPETVQSSIDKAVAAQLAAGLRGPAFAEFQFGDGSRWSTTATNGGGLGQGDPTTLTWSVIPDGTSIFGYNGEPTAPSNLRAFLDGIYGQAGDPTIPGSGWLALMQRVFDRWSELTAIDYVYEPNDDGDPWTAVSIAGGVLGVRGDVRIGGHTIDGNSGVLAYNFFPNTGDMVIDTADNVNASTANDSLVFRNVLSHEHGHGLGFSHVCPIQQTKLMEPFLATAFDGPQLDDILAGQRGYGDTNEHNDTTGTATDLGTLGDGLTTVDTVTVDATADVNYYTFDLPAGKQVDVTLTPLGSNYLSGPQNPNGSCSPGSPFDALRVNNLGFEVLDTTEASLGTFDEHGLGVAEATADLSVAAGGDFFVRVFGGTSTGPQIYQLDINVENDGTPSDLIFEDDFENNNITAWTGANETDGGNLATTGGAAMAPGSTIGIETTIPNGNLNRKFVEDPSPNNEARYRARFYFDPNSVTMDVNRRHKIFQAFGAPNSRLLTFTMRWDGANYLLRVKTHNDDNSWTQSAWMNLTNGPNVLEVEWIKATAAGADNGVQRVWLDGVLTDEQTGIDNDERFIDRARLGITGGVDANTQGSHLFDEFESRQINFIGN